MRRWARSAITWSSSTASDAPGGEVGVRVHVVVVRHRHEAGAPLGVEQDVVGQRRAERGHAAAGEVVEAAEARAVGGRTASTSRNSK
jgi:hypothetical protein